MIGPHGRGATWTQACGTRSDDVVTLAGIGQGWGKG